MNKADVIFIENIKKILNHGHNDYGEKVRPQWKDGKPAHTKFITQVSEEYDISAGEFPITSLRPIAWKSGIGEILWIYRDESNDLSLLKDKYQVTWWDEWEVGGTQTIGARYGQILKTTRAFKKVLTGLKENPFSRRHICNMWQDAELSKPGGLDMCAYETIWSAYRKDQDIFIDLTVIQRSNDYLMAGHINKMQYVALMMAVARHLGYKVGKFVHFVQNLHIYDRHFEQAEDLIKRFDIMKKQKTICQKPTVEIESSVTNFYEIMPNDFSIKNYKPVEPQLRFEIAI